MLPSFNESGYLPPGVHPATLAEITERFGQQSEMRRVQMDSVRWMIDLANRAGIQRIILNGSFATDIMEPNDVDCVLLIGRGYPRDERAARELADGLPFLQLAILRRKAFQRLVDEFFATDRLGIPKGVVELIL
jgi:hypothetical protein